MPKIEKKQIKKYTKFRPRVRSRHPSHSILRKELSLLPFRSVIRLGSVTVEQDIHAKNLIECNSVKSVQNSANKLLMKQCFTADNVKTADWWKYRGIFDNSHSFLRNITTNWDNISELPYPIVAKNIYGSRGTGNTLIKTQQELESWLQGKNLGRYIFEKFYNYAREYRLHVTANGCFYTCRKMLKQDTPEEHKWYKNDSNCIWAMEENAAFDKPSNWNNVIAESVKALKAVGLDVGAVDLRIQSAKDEKGRVRENPDFIIVEINSAPSFGEVTAQKYLEEIPKILKAKYIG